MRTFQTLLIAAVFALGACSRGGEGPQKPGTTDDNDIIDTNVDDTGKQPVVANSEVQVNILYPDDKLAKVPITLTGEDSISCESGKVEQVPAGIYEVEAESFTDASDARWFVTDGETVEVAPDESVTAEVMAHRLISSSGAKAPGAEHKVFDYNCWSYSYDNDEDTNIRDNDPYEDYNHGWFSIEVDDDGVLSFDHEEYGISSYYGGNENGLRVHGIGLQLTGDADGYYPVRMESSSIQAAGDLTFMVAAPREAEPSSDFVAKGYVEVICKLGR